MDPVTAQLVALGLTLALELPIAALLAPRASRGTVVATALFANLLSHPTASTAHSHLEVGWDGWLVIEVAVVVIETFFLRFVAELTWTRAAALALAMNALSATAGLFL